MSFTVSQAFLTGDCKSALKLPLALVLSLFPLAAGTNMAHPALAGNRGPRGWEGRRGVFLDWIRVVV